MCGGKDCIFVVGGRQRGEGACKFDLETHEWIDLPDMGNGRRCPGKYSMHIKSTKTLPLPFAFPAAVSWLVLSTPDQVVWVQTLENQPPKTFCCVLGQDTLLSQCTSLSTQVYCKWVPVNLMLGITLRWCCVPSRGTIRILLVPSCYRNWDKRRPDGLHGSYRDRKPFTVISFLIFNIGGRNLELLFHY